MNLDNVVSYIWKLICFYIDVQSIDCGKIHDIMFSSDREGNKYLENLFDNIEFCGVIKNGLLLFNNTRIMYVSMTSVKWTLVMIGLFCVFISPLKVQRSITLPSRRTLLQFYEEQIWALLKASHCLKNELES